MKKTTSLTFMLLLSLLMLKAAVTNEIGAPVTITWDPPMNSKNLINESPQGELIDVSKQRSFTYTVSRDNIELVSGLTATQYTDYGATVGEHEYCVVVVYTNPDCISVPVCVEKYVLSVGDCNAPTNFACEAEIWTRKLTWEKPDTENMTGTLLGYKLYRNSEFMALIEDPDVLVYVDEGIPQGTQHYCIEALYNDCVSEQVCVDAEPDCLPPENIDAVAEGDNIKVTWYDNPTKFTREVIFEEDFEGLEHLGGFPEGWTTIDADGDGFNWYAINHTDYTGHSGTGLATSASWNGAVLTPDNYLIIPQLFDEFDGFPKSINYWVSAQDSEWTSEHYAVMASSTGTNASDFTIVFEETLTAKGDKNGGERGTNVQGVWYERIIDLPMDTKYIAFRHFNSSDIFRINIDDVAVYASMPGSSTYALFRNGVEIANNLEVNHYTDMNVSAGTYEYCVRREAAHCVSDFTCTTITGIENAEISGVKVYPNPATDILFVKGDIKQVTMYNSLGQIVNARMFNNKIDVSSLVNGIYHIVITTKDDKQIVEKVIIAK